jgi:adenine-specific DNA-methyltransferase
MWFGKNGKARPRVKNFLLESEGIRSWTWWPHGEAGHNQEAKKEINALFGADEAFDTPKPERLIHRVIIISTNPNDIVLDSFLGSGTTAAVAHKMGRRWIGVEMGDHAVTHCVPRLQKVIDGEQGGISQAMNWKGGGGFRFYRLGPAITDESGQINRDIRFAELAAHIWFGETHGPLAKRPTTPLLGIHNGTAVYLLYNGILGDAKANALTGRVLRRLRVHSGPKLIYAECTSLDDATLQREGIVFKHIPYDIKGR